MMNTGAVIDVGTESGTEMIFSDPRLAVSSGSRALFWRARWLAPSTALSHLPFLFWLVELARPRSVVALGVKSGTGYMALCQAVDRLGLDAACMGLGNWGGQVPARLLEAHDVDYGDFSRLGDMADPFSAQHGLSKIDLLLLSTTPDSSEELSHLQTEWLPLLSDRGLVIVPDATAYAATPVGRAFMQDLSARGRLVRFDHGGGLVLACCGTAQPEGLSVLADLGFGATGRADVHRVFARLGHAHLMECQLSDARNAEDAARQARAQVAAELAGLAARVESSAAQTAALNTLLAEREQALEKALAQADTAAGLRQTVARMADAADKHEQEVAAIRAEADAAQAEILRLIEAREAAPAAILQDLEQQAEDLKAQVATRDALVQDLQGQLSDFQSRLEARNGEFRESQELAASLRDELDAAAMAQKEQIAAAAKREADLQAAATKREAKLQAMLDAARAGLEALRSDHAELVTAHEAERKKLEDRLDRSKADRNTLRETMQERERILKTALQEARDELAMLRPLQAELEELRHSTVAQEQIEQALAERDKLHAESEQSLQSQIAALQADAETLRAGLDERQAALDAGQAAWLAQAAERDAARAAVDAELANLQTQVEQLLKRLERGKAERLQIRNDAMARERLLKDALREAREAVEAERETRAAEAAAARLAAGGGLA